jgi:hypothetical protein
MGGDYLQGLWMIVRLFVVAFEEDVVDQLLTTHAEYQESKGDKSVWDSLYDYNSWKERRALQIRGPSTDSAAFFNFDLIAMHWALAAPRGGASDSASEVEHRTSESEFLLPAGHKAFLILAYRQVYLQKTRVSSRDTFAVWACRLAREIIEARGDGLQLV